MKENKENRIDSYFREGLDNLNVIPPAGVWEDIAKNLQQKKSNRGVFIWIAVAASFTLFASISGWYYFQKSGNTSRDNSIQIVTASKNNHPELNSNHSDLKNNDRVTIAKKDSEKNNVALTSSNRIEKQVRGTGSEIKNSKDQSSKSTGNGTTTESSYSNVSKLEQIPELTSRNEDVNVKEEDNSKMASIKFGLFDAPEMYGSVKNIASVNKIDTMPVFDNIYAYEDISDEKVANNKWAIGGQLAPLYSYRNISQVNTPGLNKSSMNDIEKAVITYASGIIVDYEATSRLTFQSGVYYMKMGQEINDISTFTKPTKVAYMDNVMANRAVETPVTNSTGTIKSESTVLYAFGSVNSNSEEYVPGNLALQKADNNSKNIQQSFEFLEVPFIAKYKIIDKKINVHLLGGLSTHVLVNNNTRLELDDHTVTHGKTTNVETFNYSSSMGFGVVYSLKRNLTLSIEPTFKYYLNSFNSTDAIKLHPYAFGLYSGVSFKF